MQDEVLEFIHRRFPDDCHWLDGNCYYFALILHGRFPKSKICYDMIEGHFFIKYKNKYYDWRGKYLPNSLIFWNSYEKIDSSHYNRIKKNTID